MLTSGTGPLDVTAGLDRSNPAMTCERRRRACPKGQPSGRLALHAFGPTSVATRLDQNDARAVQRARDMTLESVGQLSDDP